MQSDLDALFEVPCFKCLFWKSERESQLLCNPNMCEELTEWLLKKVEEDQQAEKRSLLLELKSNCKDQ
jgi:hypothetical protein